MRLDTKDLAMGALTATSPMLGLGANVLRHRGMNDGNILPNLGKSLSHHQVLPATLAKRVANAPRTDIGKAVLSATGGHPAISAMGATRLAKQVGQISHFDSKKLMKEALPSALKLAPQAKSSISL